MKQKLDYFVSQYKVILDMKRIYNFENFRYSSWKSSFLVFVILSSLFLGLGYLANQLDSMHYVFIGLNTVIFSPFIIYRISKELKFKYHNKIEYSNWVPLIIDFSYWLSVVLGTNAIILLILFNKVISIIFILIMLIIGIGSVVVFTVLSNSLRKTLNEYSIPKYSHLTIVIAIFSLTYIILLYALGISHITLAYLVSTLIIGSVFFLMQFRVGCFKENKRYFGLLKLMFVFILFLYMIRSVDFPITLTFIETNWEYKGTKLDVDINKLIVHDYNIYYQEGNLLYEYDSLMNLESIIDPDLDNIRYFFFADNTLKVMINDLETSSDSESFAGKIYDLTDPLNPVLDVSGVFSDLSDEDREPLIVYDGDVIFELIESGTNSIEELVGTFDYSAGNRILYQDNQEVVFYKDSIFYHYVSNRNFLSNPEDVQFYSHGKIIIQYQNNSYIVDIDDYILNQFDYDNQIDLNVGIISSFLHDGEFYYFSTLLGFKIYNDELDIVKNFDLDDELFLTDDVYLKEGASPTFVYEPYLSFQTINLTMDYYAEQIDPNNLVSLRIVGNFGIISPLAIFVIATMLLSIRIKTPSVKRGDYNG